MEGLAEKIKKTPLAEGQAGIWYLGQETFLIKCGGHYTLFDPYLSDYVDKNCCQYVTWKRNYPAPLHGRDLDFVDTVLCSHLHYDHADPWTLKELSEINRKARFIVPAPAAEKIASYGIGRERILPAAVQGEIVVNGISVKPLAAAHETFHKDNEGRFEELCYAVQFGKIKVFHAGDTCVYEGLAEKADSPDIAFLPINGRDEERNRNDIIGNMNAEEAVLFAKAAHAKLLVPMHHDLYDVNGASPAEFESAIEKHDPRRRRHIFAPGEGFIFFKNSLTDGAEV